MKKLLRYSFFALTGFAILLILVFAARQRFVSVEIERETGTVPGSAPHLTTTTHLEILPLYEEARADESFVFGHGVSYLLRTDTATILMDVGNNPDASAQLPSLQNMQALGISWEEIDAMVITHPHPDHMGGLKAWQDKAVALGNTAGDLSEMPMYVPVLLTYSGTAVAPASEPTLISPDIATTGILPFPEVFPLSLSNPESYEQALVIHVAGEGLVMITGCGHPTLETLIEHTETLYDQQVVGVVGGLHYEKISAEDVQPHIEFLALRQPKLIALSPHDSSPEALEAFRSAFPEAYRPIRVGEAIQFP